MDISDFIVGIGVLLVIIASEVSGRKKKKEVRSTPMQNRAHVSPPAYRPQQAADAETARMAGCYTKRSQAIPCRK